MNASDFSGKGLIGFFIRSPNAANLVMALMILFGVFALIRINIQFFPTAEIKIISVTVSWPGASAQDVKRNILEIIEPEVRFTKGVKEMTSHAQEGVGTIILRFKPLTDMQISASDVDSAVKAITSLPKNADPPKVRLVQFFERVANLAIIGDVPEAALRIYARIIRDDLIERGIDKVSIVGMRKRELQVEIPESRLRSLGLEISDVSRVIASNSRDFPSGQMKGTLEKRLRGLTETKNTVSLGELEIRAFATGEKIFLADIAKITNGYEEGQVQGSSGGRRAIQLTVERVANADALEMAEILDNYLRDIKYFLPPGVEIKKYQVRSNALTERITLLIRNGIGGLALVVLILFIFLNARVAFWVAAGIPVVILGTVAMMLVLGQSINMITLFAMIMMLGLIVDDAIVVGEHSATHFSQGASAHAAAESGARQMLVPVMAAMMTTAVAFAPILLIGDVIGQIMGAMPLVVIATILASLVECFFILPSHLAQGLQSRKRHRWSYMRHMVFSMISGICFLAVVNDKLTVFNITGAGEKLRSIIELPEITFMFFLAVVSLAVGALIEGAIVAARAVSNRFDRDSSVREEGIFRLWFDKKFNAFRDGPFLKLVTLSYIYRYVTVSIAIGSILIVVMGLFVHGNHVKFVFFPSPEGENISARIILNPGISENRAKNIVNAIEQSLYDTVDQIVHGDEKLVEAVFVILGANDQESGDNLAEIKVQLSSSEARSIRTSDIVKAWEKQLPKLSGIQRVFILSSRSGPPGHDIKIELYGDDAGILKQASKEVIDLVAAIPGVSGVSDDLRYGKPEMVMKLLPEGAALGFTMEEVSRQIRDAFEGTVSRRFIEGDDEIAIRVMRAARDRKNSALRNFELKSVNGEFVPLNHIVSLEERQGFSTILRVNGKTYISITANLDSSVTTIGEEINQLNTGPLPEIAEKYNLTHKFAGRVQERDSAFADLKLGVLLAIFFIYIILAGVFADYWRPVAIMLIIPFGLVGAIFGHWILGMDLTILSLIGLLGLSGILINDSIIYVSRLDERLKNGFPLQQAAIYASQDRLRAILLTSFTTIGGLIPLMFEKSLQAQFLLPMATTIVFGLALSTFLVLFLVPAIIGISADTNKMIKWIFRT